MTCTYIKGAAIGDLTRKIPLELQRVGFTDLVIGRDYSKSYLQGEVSTRCPTQSKKNGSLMKFTLQQVKENAANAPKIDVFVLGQTVEQCERIEAGDYVSISNLCLEKAVHPSSDHPCQIMVEETSNIWVLKKSKSPKVVVQPAQHATSSKKGSKAPLNMEYTELSQLTAGKVVNVIAAVMDFKRPTRSRGMDYITILQLSDPSFQSTEVRLKCNIFTSDEDSAPQVQAMGDIVRLHRLKISTYNGDLQGLKAPGFACLVFEGSVGSSMIPRTTCKTYTVTEEAKRKVRELREWLERRNVMVPPASGGTLAQCHSGQYFDLVCQVVAVSELEPGVCVLLKVWDGTQYLGPVRETDLQVPGATLEMDKPLMRRARGYVLDVCVYENHTSVGSKIKPGQFIKLFNLHAAPYSSAEMGSQHGAIPAIELCLHRGTSYNRGIKLLDEQSEFVKTLRTRLDGIQPLNSDTDSVNLDDPNLALDNQIDLCLSPEEPQAGCSRTVNHGGKRSTSGRDGQSDASGVARKRPCVHDQLSQLDSQRKANGGSSSNNSNSGNLDSSGVNRCMLETATVIYPPHHGVATSSISTVLQHPAPYKFRLQARLMDYQPKATSARQLIKLYCPVCHFLSSIPNSCGQKTNVTNTSMSQLMSSQVSQSAVRDMSISQWCEPLDQLEQEAEEEAEQNLWTCMLVQLSDGREIQARKKMLASDSEQQIHVSNVTKEELAELRSKGYKVHVDRDFSVESWLRSAQPSLVDTEKGDEYFKCPECARSSAATKPVQQDGEKNIFGIDGADVPKYMSGVPVLQYIFMLVLLLKDETDWLPVQLWKDQAEKFFLDVSPLDVLHDETAFKKMKTSLEELCGPSDRPSLECCVQSFTGHSGICYQMFDTVLAD